jgi:hypothetical protein
MGATGPDGAFLTLSLVAMAGRERGRRRVSTARRPGSSSLLDCLPALFGGRIGRMGRWRRGARHVSLAELRELLRADRDELAAALDRRPAAHRATRRDAARQRYLTWLQRELQTSVPPAEMTPDELNALITDWKLRRVGLVRSRKRANVRPYADEG